MTKNYLWTDNPTEANVAMYDPDILNECLMHLKYEKQDLSKFCINSASTDAAGAPNLLTYSGNTLNFNCGNSLITPLGSNVQGTWSVTSSHLVNTSANDVYKSFDSDPMTYCAQQGTPSADVPMCISINNTSAFTFDYLYLKFGSVTDAGSIKSFFIKDNEGNILFNYNNIGAFLDKDTFLIPISRFNSTKVTICATSNVNNVNYVNFPNTIKLLDRKQVVSLTNSQGANAILAGINSINLNTNGTFNIFLGTDGSIDSFATNLTFGKALPANPITNQIHYLTDGEPPVAKKFNGTLWLNYDKAYVGKVTVTNNVISSVTTNPYNQNGYDLHVNSWGNIKHNGAIVYTAPRTVIETYSNGTSWYRIWSDGWIEQGGHYTAVGQGLYSINLLVTFTDTNYSFSRTPRVINASATNSAYNNGFTTKLTNRVDLLIETPSFVTGYDWFAYGY